MEPVLKCTEYGGKKDELSYGGKKDELSYGGKKEELSYGGKKEELRVDIHVHNRLKF